MADDKNKPQNSKIDEPSTLEVEASLTKDDGANHGKTSSPKFIFRLLFLIALIVSSPWWGDILKANIDPLLGLSSADKVSINWQEQRVRNLEIRLDTIIDEIALIQSIEYGTTSDFDVNKLDDLSIEVKDLQDKIAEISANAASKSNAANNSNAIDFSFFQTLAKLEVDVSANKEQLKNLEIIISELNKQNKSLNLNNGLLTIATANLGSALLNGQDYSAPLNLLQQLAYKSADLNQEITGKINNLAELSSNRIWRLDQLSIYFQEHAESIHLHITTPDQGDWIELTLAKLRQLVSIRKTEGLGDLPEVTKAIQLLDAGQLSDAVELLTPFQDKSDILKNWLNLANEHLTAYQAYHQLEGLMLERLSQHD